MLGPAALPFGGVAGKQDRNGMKVGPGEAADPVVRMIWPVSPSISARATMPCLNSSGNVAREASSTPSARRPFQVKATVTQRLFLSTEAVHRCGRLHRFQDCRQPGPSTRGVAKRKEFVSAGERRRARQQDVLDVVEFKHGMRLAVHCIWSSMFENAALSFRAFLISSALTKGYSPYSRKLGH